MTIDPDVPDEDATGLGGPVVPDGVIICGPIDDEAIREAFAEHERVTDHPCTADPGECATCEKRAQVGYDADEVDVFDTWPQQGRGVTW